MAEPRRKTSGATVDKSNTVGEYTELPGGGTPIEAGKRAPSDAWVAEHRKLQPRDGEGKFTYNSANRKKLEYGPSRGTTVPPFLEGINLTYVIKSKSPLIIGGKNGIDPQRLVARRDLDIDSFMDIFKEYDVEKGSFKGFTNAFEKKKGRQSKVEKQMLSGKKTGVTKPGDEEVMVAGYEEFISDFKERFSAYKQKQQNKKLKNVYKETNTTSSKQPNAQPNQPNKQPVIQKSFAEQAKNNPMGFAAEHESELKDIENLAKEKGFSIDMEALISEIGNGNFKDIESVKSFIENYSEN